MEYKDVKWGMNVVVTEDVEGFIVERVGRDRRAYSVAVPSGTVGRVYYKCLSKIGVNIKRGGSMGYDIVQLYPESFEPGSVRES